MESLVEVAIGLLCLIVLCIPLGFVFRYRGQIKRWLTDTGYGKTWEQDAVKRAERAVTRAEWRLEDARDHLLYQKDRKAKDNGETGD